MKKTHGFRNSTSNNEASLYGESKAKSTLETLFDKFIKEKRYLANLAPRTLDSYTEVFARYKRFVGTEMPNEERLDQFVMGMREAGFAVTTVNISIRSFNVFLGWLHKEGKLPVLKMRQMKQQKRVMKTFSDEQLRVLLAWRPRPKVRNEIRLHCLLLLLLGYRNSNQ